VSLALLLPGAVLAQGPPAGTDVYQLQLEPNPDVKSGKIATLEGVAGTAGQKLAVGDLSVLQPVEVTLFAPDENDDIRLELSKFILDSPAKTCSTKGNAFCTVRFRTQGDLQINVVSPDGPKLYRLLVWAGSEVAAPVMTPLVSMSEYKKTNRTGGPPVLWVIAGVLVVIAGLLAVLVLRKGRQ
jgi:hypothetical protein